MAGITIKLKGPVFDGRASAQARAFCHDLEHEVATEARSKAKDFMAGSFKRPTPYYWTRLMVYPAGGGTRVSDAGIIYGPWLEGVGSRNAPVTRFRGYHSFRRAANAMKGPAVRRIARMVIKRYPALGRGIG